MSIKTQLGIELYTAITEAYKKGNKVLICGNGGLAAESEHFAAELMGKFGKEVFIPCIALTANSSLVTALSNDFGFNHVFAHQVEVLGKNGDIFIGMTTSNSENILLALGMAIYKDLYTVAICGEKSEVEADRYHKTYRMHGEGSAAIQNEVISFLHYIAYNAKRNV
jgi:D-sedoheptulose 7-phosphate isomerase